MKYQSIDLTLVIDAFLLLIGIVLGELVARLLHFSTGSLSIAGELILVIIAVTMVLGTELRSATWARARPG